MSSKARYDWCHHEYIHLRVLGRGTFNTRTQEFEPKINDYPKHQRCKRCNRMLQTIVRSCQDDGCLHLYLSPHKRRIKSIRTVRKTRLQSYQRNYARP